MITLTDTHTDHTPLVVDLDGTLLRSDLLIESGLAFIRQHPLKIWQPLLWLRHGKAMLKEQLAQSIEVDVAVLPYEPQVLEFVRKERHKGRPIILATASHRLLADRVAGHLGLFDEVLATSHQLNLSAGNKRDALVERFGSAGYDYIGNSRDDLPVWASARKAYIVNPTQSLVRQACAQGRPPEEIVTRQQSVPRDWLRAMRLHQWLKNFLIFIPLLAAHQVLDPGAILQTLFAFLVFGLTASSVYLLNDMLDLADDRHHPGKSRRPFAAGTLSLAHGLLVFPGLLTLAALLSIWWLPWNFLLVLLAYYTFTLAYSFRLKRHAATDVICLAALYTVRIIAGAAALELPLTFWILAFSMFIFLSLALVKRYAELADLRQRGGSKTRGRGYYPEDMPLIASLGTAAGYLSVLVFALYIHSQETLKLYQQPELLWLACPLLLLWVTRIWLITHRGQMHEDPVVFAAKDRFSWIVISLMAITFWIAA